MNHPYEWAGAAVLVAAMLAPRISMNARRALTIGAFVILLAGDLAARQWFDVALDATVIALNLRWWGRGKRRKAARLLGAKSKALRDALVRRAREVAQPRPVLRPVPVPS